jgi:DNA-binding response OmpR family regulator
MKILVIEDDAVAREFIRWGLTEDGHTVDVAESGAEGARAVRVNPYDAVVLDLMLPDTTGLEVVRQLRQERRDVPVLMLTGTSHVNARIEGLDAGADDYLTKPFEMGELKARLRALVRRGGATRTEQLRIGSLTLDRLAHQLQAGGKPLRLTPKEYRLLEYLVMHAEQVVSRTDLLEKVWEVQFDPQSNVVDVTVARIRSKLGARAGAPRIETVRGFGFRLTTAPPSGDEG